MAVCCIKPKWIFFILDDTLSETNKKVVAGLQKIKM
jgi:hypothetical protein